MEHKVYLELFEKNAETIMKMFEEAHILHASVNQTYDEHLPYSYHLNQVGMVAARHGHRIVNSEDDIKAMMFAAFFHDSIEDARLTYNDVVRRAEKYMDKVTAIFAADLVYALTNEKGKNRAERENDKYFEEMRNCNGAPFLKFCDRIANMSHAKVTKSSLFKKYKQELPDFLRRIGDCVPPDMVEELKEIAGE